MTSFHFIFLSDIIYFINNKKKRNKTIIYFFKLVRYSFTFFSSFDFNILYLKDISILFEYYKYAINSIPDNIFLLASINILYWFIINCKYLL